MIPCLSIHPMQSRHGSHRGGLRLCPGCPGKAPKASKHLAAGPGLLSTHPKGQKDDPGAARASGFTIARKVVFQVFSRLFIEISKQLKEISLEYLIMAHFAVFPCRLKDNMGKLVNYHE